MSMRSPPTAASGSITFQMEHRPLTMELMACSAWIMLSSPPKRTKSSSLSTLSITGVTMAVLPRTIRPLEVTRRPGTQMRLLKNLTGNISRPLSLGIRDRQLSLLGSLPMSLVAVDAIPVWFTIGSRVPAPLSSPLSLLEWFALEMVSALETSLVIMKWQENGI